MSGNIVDASLGTQRPEAILEPDGATLSGAEENDTSAARAVEPGGYRSALGQARKADAWVRRNPWMAVSIGVLIGRYLAGRRRRVI